MHIVSLCLELSSFIQEKLKSRSCSNQPVSIFIPPPGIVSGWQVCLCYCICSIYASSWRICSVLGFAGNTLSSVAEAETSTFISHNKMRSTCLKKNISQVYRSGETHRVLEIIGSWWKPSTDSFVLSSDSRELLLQLLSWWDCIVLIILGLQTKL